jgi:hypothetical protein
MSEINDPIPFINYGQQEAGIGNTNASTNLMGQQAALTSQQAQQAAMATQIQRASMPMIMQTMNEAYSDQSGANPGNPDAGIAALPNGTVPPGMTRAAAAPTADYTGVNVEDALRTQNYVQPFTPQEQNMVRMGTMMSFNPQTAAAGTALVERAKTQAAMRVANQTALNQLKMGNMYDTSASVFDAPLPQAMSLLQQVNPAAAASLQAQAAKDGSDPNQLAHDYAGHLAAVPHLYSGRPTHSDNGQLIDDKTEQPVAGQAQTYTGLTPEQRQKTIDSWNQEWKWTTPDGRDHTDARWRAPSAYGGLDGKITPYQAALFADQAVRQRTPGTPGATAAPGNAPNAAGTSPSGAAGITPEELDNIVHESGAANQYGPPVHGAAAATRVAAKNATSATAPAQTNSGLNAAAGTGGATATDSGLLPGVNPLQLANTPASAGGAKMVTPVDQGQGGPGTTAKEMQSGLGTRSNAALTNTAESIQDAQKTRALLAQAKLEISKLDPRTVGPGSTLYNGMLKTYTAAAGEAPDALIDENVLDKFLNQIGAQNVRQLLQGQRITNQEMMTFLTRGSPSTSMPLGGIQHLVNYLDADNEYTLRYNRTKQIALKSGADPDLIDGAMDPNGTRRAQFVMGRTGGSPTLASHTPQPGATSTQPDQSGYIVGRLYPGANGTKGRYLGNGQWQQQ